MADSAEFLKTIQAIEDEALSGLKERAAKSRESDATFMAKCKQLMETGFDGLLDFKDADAKPGSAEPEKPADAGRSGQ